MARNEQVRVMMEPEDKEKLREYARFVDRSESYVGNQAIKRFLATVDLSCPTIDNTQAAE